ncbi:hypothetical protein Bca4012_085305 [Brassica carinata]
MFSGQGFATDLRCACSNGRKMKSFASETLCSKPTITAANKTVIPAVSAVKFPELAVTLSSGKVLKLHVTSGSSEVNAKSLVVPKEMISSWSKPFLEPQFLVLRQLTMHIGEVVCPTCNADGEPEFYKENQMMKCSACYGRGLIALKDRSDSK